MRAGLFPGQGLESRVVLDALPAHHPLYSPAKDVLGYDVRHKVEQVSRRSRSILPTDLAQPAIFLAGVVAHRDAVDDGTTFDFLVGHSLGEYTALVAAGSIPFSHGLRLVAARGRAMRRAAKLTEGGMAAVIGLATSQVAHVCKATSVTLANDNSPAQAVVSGAEDALAAAAENVRSMGGRIVLLPVDGAYHSNAMGPAVEELSQALDRTDVRMPGVPVISNVSARPYRSPGEIRKLLLLQLTTQVRFRNSILWLNERGVDEFVDLGPGRVVGRLAEASVRTAGKVAADA